MVCYDNCLIPLILIYRCIVWACFCCFKHTQTFYSSISEQLESRRSFKGGWYENIHRDFTSTRDTFFILTALYEIKDLETYKYEWKYIQRLNRHMTHLGQLPWGFNTHWYNGEVPIYENQGVKVVDANAQFIIMLARYYTHMDCDVDISRQTRREMHTMWLAAQRAWEWLDVYIQQDVFIEPIGASWTHSIVHDGQVLLTNVYITQAIRSMELLAIYNRDSNQQNKFQKLHQSFLARLVPEIYKTQETLPRILAVYWNMVPNTFITSFNAQLTCSYVPLRIKGPIKVNYTWSSRLRGNYDQFTNVIWPWIGLFWIVVLAKKTRRNLVKGWWTSYMEYHNPNTIYDMYSPDDFKPVRRAFLKASPMHALSLAMQMAAAEVSFDNDLI